jgi:holo-[acyl-carrier protein] synthase
MILGIGTDILKIQHIRNMYNGTDDPFFQKTFTENEKKQASVRPDPVIYFSTRFTGKEAVFKSLGIDGSDIRLDDIEILNSETGQPVVVLSGNVKEIAERKGIKYIHISLSYNDDYAVAFAIAEA